LIRDVAVKPAQAGFGGDILGRYWKEQVERKDWDDNKIF
jgi:hypothetical protein